MLKIQKAALIGTGVRFRHCKFNMPDTPISYAQRRRQINNLNDYLKLILPEDGKSFHQLAAERKPKRKNKGVDFTLTLFEGKDFLVYGSKALHANIIDKNTILEAIYEDVIATANDINLCRDAPTESFTEDNTRHTKTVH